MGVPAFFRWLSKKYSSIIIHCVEEKIIALIVGVNNMGREMPAVTLERVQTLREHIWTRNPGASDLLSSVLPQKQSDVLNGKIVDGVKIPVDTSKPNPNDVEFDNLYLDMNGIIHPCCHPEDKPAPKNEDEMMVLIFEYIDRLFNIVRPRKVLYMAIDGVAPRAKMNQQRSRRFRASKESSEKIADMARIRGELEAKGIPVPPEKPASEHFDSNCITPGTPFMFRLAECLRYYIHARLNSDPGWQGIKVILSDANVPGEGEHKIMDYIRRQRAQPDHDPNTQHCLCGADADLIMLGLATHEPNFTIIREEFKPNQPRPCDMCGQLGHEMKDCIGLAKEKQGEHDELTKTVCAEQEFIFIRLCVAREYLERELRMTNLPFPQDIERAIDDWVFMCFFVGNDFLPHLPSLEIREGAIDRLVRLYKKAVLKTGGYLTDSGIVNLARVQLVLTDLGEAEDEIFKQRRETELKFRRINKEKRRRARRFNDAPRWLPRGQFAPQAVGDKVSPVSNPRQTARDMRAEAAFPQDRNASNQDAAASLRAMLKSPGEEKAERGVKRPHQDEDSEPEPEDDVKLWEDGWKDRYYESKFGVDSSDRAFRVKVAHEYVIGLCWVLRYYYQGCASWKWYFPYHYAPFASDFVGIADLPNDFEKNTKPFRPLEQLMGVFPAASKKHLPVTWQTLMCQPESDIIDFYPTDFKIDLNGKKYAWQGVALLPFVDENRLRKALEAVYPDLTEEEKSRNVWGSDRLFLGRKHTSHAFLEALYEGELTTEKQGIFTDPTLAQGMKGQVWCDKFVCIPGETLKSPLPALQDIENNQAICVCFKDPQYDPDYIFPAKFLPGAVKPPPTLKPEDFNKTYPGQSYRPQLGFQRHSGYRPGGSYNSSSAQRFIRGNLSSDKQKGGYSNVPPPSTEYRGQQRRHGMYGQGNYNSGQNQRYQNDSNHRRDDRRGFLPQHQSRFDQNVGGIGSQYGGQQQYNSGGYGGQAAGRNMAGIGSQQMQQQNYGSFGYGSNQSDMSRQNQHGNYGSYGNRNNQRGQGGGRYSQHSQRY